MKLIIKNGISMALCAAASAAFWVGSATAAEYLAEGDPSFPAVASLIILAVGCLLASYICGIATVIVPFMKEKDWEDEKNGS